jgi:gas vesicle protein
VHDKLRYVGVALVAGTVGAMVALLIAPQSGRDTRKLLKKRYRRERDAIAARGRKAIEGAEDYVQERLQDGRRAIDDVSERVVDSMQAGKKKVTRLVRS